MTLLHWPKCTDDNVAPGQVPPHEAHQKHRASNYLRDAVPELPHSTWLTEHPCKLASLQLCFIEMAIELEKLD